MMQNYKDLKDKILDLMDRSKETGLNSACLDTVRIFLSYCDDHLSPEEYDDEEQAFFRSLSGCLIAEKNKDSLGEEAYSRINADFYRVRIKLEGGSCLSTKQCYLACVSSYAEKAVVVPEESIEENAQPIAYMNEAVSIFAAMTDEEKQDSGTCYYIGEIFYQLGLVWADFDAIKSLAYFRDMLSVIEGGKRCLIEEYGNSDEEAAQFIANRAIAVNWAFSEMFERSEDPDESDRMEAMWAEILEKWLPMIDQYTDRDREDEGYLSALINSYYTMGESLGIEAEGK